jgi:adenosylcobinamide kinase / adenosylcobinamide-phosphate guanylyltransferase
MAETILVLGGTRSGKSRLAEGLVGERGPFTYLATAVVDPADAEMVARVDRHRAARPAGWTTREVPRDLEGALTRASGQGGAVLVESVTLWITNLMLGLGGGPALEDPAILDAADRAVRAPRGPARVIWVSDEVGSGGVPENALARRFADLLGLVNQRIAGASGRVLLCVAGLPVTLK